MADYLIEANNLSAAGNETCSLCVEEEVAKLVSLCVALKLEPKNREDVRNLIEISGYSPLYNDSAFVNQVIEMFLERI